MKLEKVVRQQKKREREWGSEILEVKIKKCTASTTKTSCCNQHTNPSGR